MVIREDRENVASFLIRLCSVIAGIVVICGLCNSIIQAVFDQVFSFLLPQYKDKEGSQETKVNLLAPTTVGKFDNSHSSGAAKTNLLLTNDMLKDHGSLSSQFVPFK